MKNSYLLISLALTLIIGFVSCNKNQFAKRKYMPGTHRDHSVKVKKPKSNNGDQFIVENKTINQDSLYVDSNTTHQEVAYYEDINFENLFDDSLKNNVTSPLDTASHKERREYRKRQKIRKRTIKDSLANDREYQLKSKKEQKRIEEELINESEDLKKTFNFSLISFLLTIGAVLFFALSLFFGTFLIFIALAIAIVAFILLIASFVKQSNLKGTSEAYSKKANSAKALAVFTVLILIVFFIFFGILIPWI